MKNFILVISLIITFTIYPSQANAITMPCSVILEPVDKTLLNAKGTALVYKVQLYPPSSARTNVSILAVHLPNPSSYGDYDSYEGFVFIPNEISWQFKLYPTPEENSPTWSGRFDEITADLENARVQVRLFNLKTLNLGPIILTNNIKDCK